MYSKIYDTTITFFPGAFYIVGGGLKVIALVIFLKMYVSHKRKQTVSYDVEQKPQKDNGRLSETEDIENFDSRYKTVFTIGDILSLHVT